MDRPQYVIEFLPRALKDLDRLPPQDRTRVLQKVEELRDGLRGDVKRLMHFVPDYRLRVGIHRVLFEVFEHRVLVHRIQHRKDAYRS